MPALSNGLWYAVEIAAGEPMSVYRFESARYREAFEEGFRAGMKGSAEHAWLADYPLTDADWDSEEDDGDVREKTQRYMDQYLDRYGIEEVG